MNKLKIFLHGILPAFLLAASVGQIYAFTNFSTEISEALGASQGLVQFAFSLGIFFLGMGAAFFGPVVEKNIKLSALVGGLLFICGMALAQVAVITKSLALLYIGYGVLLGLGTGVIYITPVKTMMMWLPGWRAVAAALPIIFFGLGSSFSTILHVKLQGLGITRELWAYALIYAVSMLAGGLLLKKPEEAEKKLQSEASDFSYKKLVKDRFFIHSWLFMLINISAGLCLIPLAKQMMKDPAVGYTAAAAALIIALSGLFNGGGRFFFALLSDKLRDRMHIIICICTASLAALVTVGISPFLIGPVLLLINACYGAGFSVIPAILSMKYGMHDISKIHGAVLSAWGVAGLCGNQLAILTGVKFGFIGVVVMICLLHAIGVVNYFLWRRASKA